LIRQMAAANPLWGAPRIHGELQKVGISVSQATVAKYMPRRDTPPSQPWRTFLANHAPARPRELCRVLLEHADAPESRQGRTGVTARHATLRRTHRRDSAGQRVASPATTAQRRSDGPNRLVSMHCAS
jgi:hypothetical protein